MRPDLARHPPGWLALSLLSVVMAVGTWPSRLSPAAWLQRPAARPTIATPTLPFTPTPGPVHRAGGFDAFSRGTGTALPVLATVVDPTPMPPGPRQVVRCRSATHGTVYADSWSACPRGVGELLTVVRR